MNPRIPAKLGQKEKTRPYLWQRHIRNNNLIQSTRRVLDGPRLVAVRMILVLGDLLAGFRLLVRDVPRHRALSDAHVALGRRARRAAAEVPSRQAETANHDGHESLDEKHQSKG